MVERTRNNYRADFIRPERGFMRNGRYESSDGIRTTATAITFFIIGAGAGALAALLLAPKTGKQFRKDLHRGYDDAREAFGDWADDAADNIRDRVREAGDVVRDAATRGVRVASDFADDLRETARENIEPIRRAVKRS
jgi:gas vesicle protein